MHVRPDEMRRARRKKWAIRREPGGFDGIGIVRLRRQRGQIRVGNDILS